MIFNTFNFDEISDEIIEKYYQQILNDTSYFEKNNINELNHNGSSLLFYAVIWKNVPFIKLLLNKGCDVNIINRYGDSSLTLADKEVFEIIINNENLNKEKILPSLITSRWSSCYQKNNFSLFLEVFEQEIIKLSHDQLQHINRAVVTIKEPLIEQWNTFCQNHNINNNITNVFRHHMLKYSNRNLSVFNNNCSNSIDKQQAIDAYKNLYNEIKKKFNQFVFDLTEITKKKNQQKTDDFLLSSSIKREIAQFLKLNERGESAISNHDIECGLYKEEMSELYNLTKLLISGKSDSQGNPRYLSSDNYLNLLSNDWEKINLENNIDIKPIQDMLTKYNLKGLVFDKNINIDTLIYVLNVVFSIIEDVLKIKSSKIGQGELFIDCSISKTNENALGIFSFEKKSLWINTNQIYLSDHIKDISQPELNNFISTFIHEYTHFLQFINENPQRIFENHLEKEWKSILKTINYKKYSKEDIDNIFINFAKEIMLKEEILIENDKIDNLKLQINDYFENHTISSLKKIKSIIIKDTTKENELFIDFKKMLDLFKEVTKNPEAFQEEIWKNYRKVFDGEYNSEIRYWSDPIEIHARLNQEVFVNESGNMLDVGHFLSVDEKNDLIQLLKPKLEKFNQLLIAHREDYINKLSESKNKTKTTYKLY